VHETRGSWKEVAEHETAALAQSRQECFQSSEAGQLEAGQVEAYRQIAEECVQAKHETTNRAQSYLTEVSRSAERHGSELQALEAEHNRQRLESLQEHHAITVDRQKLKDAFEQQKAKVEDLEVQRAIQEASVQARLQKLAETATREQEEAANHSTEMLARMETHMKSEEAAEAARRHEAQHVVVIRRAVEKMWNTYGPQRLRNTAFLAWAQFVDLLRIERAQSKSADLVIELSEVQKSSTAAADEVRQLQAQAEILRNEELRLARQTNAESTELQAHITSLQRESNDALTRCDALKLEHANLTSAHTSQKTSLEQRIVELDSKYKLAQSREEFTKQAAMRDVSENYEERKKLQLCIDDMERESQRKFKLHEGAMESARLDADSKGQHCSRLQERINRLEAESRQALEHHEAKVDASLSGIGAKDDHCKALQQRIDNLENESKRVLQTSEAARTTAHHEIRSKDDHCKRLQERVDQLEKDAVAVTEKHKSALVESRQAEAEAAAELDFAEEQFREEFSVVWRLEEALSRGAEELLAARKQGQSAFAMYQRASETIKRQASELEDRASGQSEQNVALQKEIDALRKQQQTFNVVNAENEHLRQPFAAAKSAVTANEHSITASSPAHKAGNGETTNRSIPKQVVEEITRLFTGAERDKILAAWSGTVDETVVSELYRCLSYKKNDLRDVLLSFEGSLTKEAVAELYQALSCRPAELKSLLLRFKASLDAGAVKEINKALGYKPQDLTDVLSRLPDKRLDAAAVLELNRAAGYNREEFKKALLAK